MFTVTNDELEQARQKIIDNLKIDIDKFLEKIILQSEKTLDLCQTLIIYRSLLGDTPQKIADEKGLQNSDQIRTFLNKRVYDFLPNLFYLECKINEWVKILNLLLDPENGYQLNPPPRLNDNNFQSSHGNQFFLIARHKTISELQIRGTEFYQKGLYYKALDCFFKAWNEEQKADHKGSPEILIYLNNSWIEKHRKIIEKNQKEIYTIAVVVPIHHNFGRVATEILQGIAQLQLMINLETLDLNLEDGQNLKQSFLKNFNLETNLFFTVITQKNILLKILIVNESNNLYAEQNQTAQYLVNLKQELNIIAVIGHYSSEMTKKAVKIYANHDLLLITPSSTSNELSELPDSKSLFRMTTPDNIAAQRIFEYLSQRFEAENTQNVSILYNRNSSYSCSFRKSIRQSFLENSKFRLVNENDECDYIYEEYRKVRDYLQQHQNIQIIIVVPDGGIEPNSCQNSGLISRFSQNMLIVGSATLYHENLLEWLELEHSESFSTNIVVCIPWHYYSQTNGYNSHKSLSEYFCKLGDLLWGKTRVTWRSATSFDSGLILVKTLAQYAKNSDISFKEYFNQYFRENNRYETGVTGKIEFGQNCDRIDSPTEIVAVVWKQDQQKWSYEPV